MTACYVADMNVVLTLASGNWFTGFVADIEKREVTFTYHDHRRHGQIARKYIVKFSEDLSTVEDIIAVSACAGRIEHFKSTIASEVCANIIRNAQMVKIEQGFLVEDEQKKEKFFNNDAFISGLFIILALIEVITCLSLFVIPEGTGLFELISNVFLTSSVGALIVGLFAVHKSIC